MSHTDNVLSTNENDLAIELSEEQLSEINGGSTSCTVSVSVDSSGKVTYTLSCTTK